MIELQRKQIEQLNWKVMAHERFELRTRKVTSAMLSSIKELMAQLVETDKHK